MALGLVSPLLNRGVRSRWLASLPVAGSKMLTIDSNGDTSFQDIPVAAWGSITGTLSAQTDLQSALDGKLSLTGGTLTGPLTGTSQTIEQRNSTNSQTLRIYNTFTDASNYIRQSLSFTTYSTTVHAQHVVEGAGTGAVNVPFVVTPRGTGAFILGPMPDGTATGGNARGANAVDLQTSRSAATQVASGQGSFVCNMNGTASGEACWAGGGNTNGGCNVSGASNFAFGRAITNNASYYAAAFGYGGTMSSNFGFAVGQSFSCTGAEYQYSFGRDNVNTGAFSLTLGANAVASRQGERAFAIGNFANQGDAQHTQFVLRIKTTNNTPTTMLLGPTQVTSTTRLTIPSGKLFLFTAKIVGVKSDGTSRACYVRKGAIINIAGTTSLVGTIDTVGTDVEDNAATDVAITADNTNDALDISVTGITSETWRWVAVVEGVEVAYGT